MKNNKIKYIGGSTKDSRVSYLNYDTVLMILFAAFNIQHWWNTEGYKWYK